MSVPHGYSEACCRIPPVIAEGYEPKGAFHVVNGRKIYVTGSSTATTGILYVADVFGFSSQQLQGADILASTGDATKYQVFIPDFFDGKPANINWYPPQNDEQRAALGVILSSLPTAVASLPQIVKDIEQHHPNIQQWGAVGFCWGGKVVSLTSGAGTMFKAAAQCHPGKIDKKDAEATVIPMMMLASMDEDAKVVKEYDAALTVEKHVEIFGDQIHGWMATRGDLSDARVKAEYERGYKLLLSFFDRHLK